MTISMRNFVSADADEPTDDAPAKKVRDRAFDTRQTRKLHRSPPSFDDASEGPPVVSAIRYVIYQAASTGM
jgi:hypothetical protein